MKRGDGTSNLIEFIEWIEPIMVQQFGNLALVLRTKKAYVPRNVTPEDYYYETGDAETELSIKNRGHQAAHARGQRTQAQPSPDVYAASGAVGVLA